MRTKTVDQNEYYFLLKHFRTEFLVKWLKLNNLDRHETFFSFQLFQKKKLLSFLLLSFLSPFHMRKKE